MREELLDAHYEVIRNPSSKSAFEMYREKSERIGPNIVIDECLKVNKLQAEVEQLKEESKLFMADIRTQNDKIIEQDDEIKRLKTEIREWERFNDILIEKTDRCATKRTAEACIKIIGKYAFTSSAKAEIKEKYGLEES